jgi:hypothetical protein
MLELIEIFLFGSSDPNMQLAFIPAVMALGGLAQVASGIDWGGKRKDAAKKAKKAYEDQRAIYEGLDTSNAFGDIRNMYTGMENTMEDLTVNTQQAEFERGMFQQSQANTMSQLRGAAGSSGVAGLAQAMSNQAMTQAQRASASIGQQEAKNKLLMAQEASRIDQLERTGADTTQQLKAKGKLSSMQMEQSKQATLLGMDAQAHTAAQQAVLQGQQAVGEGISSVIGGVASAYTPGVGGEKGSFNFWK